MHRIADNSIHPLTTMTPTNPRSRRKPKQQATSILTWPQDTEIIRLVLEVQPEQDSSLYPQYTIGLHAWFLEQVRQTNPELSAYLHDGQSEKPFTLSGLVNPAQPQARSLQLKANQTYEWSITALSKPVVQWLAHWLENPPTVIELRGTPLIIRNWAIAHPATTYAQLWQIPVPNSPTVTLSFSSPTSFRRKGLHLPLPWPTNVFHSYLRRWNDFSDKTVNQETFLDWVDEFVLILRHELKSLKVAAGKRGSVTGFTGAIEFGLSPKAREDKIFQQVFWALGQFAPYCGTGHKTTFGLGQTHLGWTATPTAIASPSVQDLLAQRIAELSQQFISQRKRLGGERATKTAETWATILARRELGESLQAIAEDLEMSYETVKTYAKLARKAIKAD